MRASEFEPIVIRALAAIDSTVELWGIELHTNGPDLRLCIYIEKSGGGLNVDDCGKASKQINRLLTAEGKMKDDLSLEVSSPGMNRRLFKFSHVEASVGQQVKLRTVMAIDGRRQFKGQLTGAVNDHFTVVNNDDTWEFPMSAIETIRIIADI